MTDTHAPIFDTSIFETVIAEGSRRDRWELAVQLADLLCDPETPQDEVEAVTPVVLALTEDEDETVREELALGLVNCPDLDPRVIASIAADDDRIALPFIGRVEMSEACMAAIARAGDEARQKVIAARADIGPKSISALIEAGSEEAVKALLENPAAAPDEKQLKKLYVRFWKHGDIVEQLLSFEALPLDIRLIETRRASHRMQALVKANDWVPGDDGKGTVVDAQDRAVIAIFNAARPEDLLSLVAFASSKELLTATLLLKAAVDGHMHIVERALAWLNSTSVKRVRKLMYEHGALSLRSLTVAGGLPDECFPVLRAAADVAREAKADKDWPAPERFGRKVVETLLTRQAVGSAKEKMRILAIVADNATGATKALARHLIDAIDRAA
ncbi:MAG: DUF2336 domain-containing protein [Hyphomicrobiales bacterium]